MFCGNLAPQVTKEDVEHHFSQAGLVREVRLMRDRQTGKPRAFGFVDFNDLNAARAAVSLLDGSDLQGRPLRLEIAASKPEANKRAAAELMMNARIEGIAGLEWPANACSCAAVASVPDDPTAAQSGSVTLGECGVSGTRDDVNSLSVPQLWEIVHQTQALVEQDVRQARELLVANPGLALAVLRAQIRLGVATKEAIREVLTKSPG